MHTYLKTANKAPNYNGRKECLTVQMQIESFMYLTTFSLFLTLAASPEATESQRLESEAAEPPQASTATAASPGEQLGQEEQLKSPTPPTKEPSEAPAPAEEEAMEVSTDVPPAAKPSEEATAATLVPKEEGVMNTEQVEVEKKKMVLKVEKESSSKAVDAEAVAPVAVVVKEERAEFDRPEDMETTSSSSGGIPQPVPSTEVSSTTQKPSSVLDAHSESAPFGVSHPPLSPRSSPAKLPQDDVQLQLQLPEVETEPPFSPVDFSTAIPPAMFLPITPKIGMGKPAITKRKFSPGRPRVRQVRSFGKSSHCLTSFQATCLCFVSR